MRFEIGQKVRLVARVENLQVDDDGDVLLSFNGRRQHLAAEAVEERLKDNRVVICVEYSYSAFSPSTGDTFIFKTAPGHSHIFLQEENIVLADEGEDK